MKVFAFLVAFACFVAGLLLFGYAFDAAPGWDTALFSAGLLGVAVSLMIPFHLLEKFD
ncbi:hypothetical protein BH09ACT4_BH09ACT4_19500 [soil metagenome]